MGKAGAQKAAAVEAKKKLAASENSALPRLVLLTLGLLSSTQAAEKQQLPVPPAA